YSIDSSAHAVIMADVGSTEMDLSRGNYAVEFTRHIRIHILDKNAYEEATFQIPTFHDRNGNNGDRIDDIRAVSYNLNEGKVEETKMGKDAIFTDKAARSVDITKFTLPAVHEGTIIDVQYKIFSGFRFGIRGYAFQGRLPRLWTEYKASIPSFTQFQIDRKGYLDVATSTEEHSAMLGQLSIVFTDHRWVAENVPGFKPEGFVSAASNYLSRVEFHLTALTAPLEPQTLVTSWPTATRRLLEDEDFGRKFDQNNPWLDDVMQPMMKGTQLEQARAIYAYVRDKIKCEGNSGSVYLTQSVRDVLRKGSATVSDVNLLLVTMLRHAGIQADPVMLSTRENGFVYTLFPMLNRFNYVITIATIDGQTIYLDASKPRLGFGRLMPECYNGMGRVINSNADVVLLPADSLREKSNVGVMLGLDGKNGWKGYVQEAQGHIASYESRSTIQEKGQDAFRADPYFYGKGFAEVGAERILALSWIVLRLSYEAMWPCASCT
ncbi:MAG: transglutaminase domain-containing protein, partial [Chitinophagaceae bacterium]